MSDPGLASFFQRYNGRRLDVADNQPIERGMTDAHLREELSRYQSMIETGMRQGGVAITPRERNEISIQIARFESELSLRGRSNDI